MLSDISGYVHSFQSLGALDGPGVRYTVFLSGCNLRCSCCHNPDTWERDSGEKYTVGEVLSRALRYREYFGKDGGITLTGGEPILQPEFATALFTLCHENGINTCLDTSGSLLNERVKELLAATDRVLLDIKYTSNELYKKHVGCSMDEPLRFLSYLNEKGIKTTLRQVIIPTLNDTEENILALKSIKEAHPCVDNIELLPFKKICTVKYESLGIPFPLAEIPTPTPDLINKLQEILL